MSQQKKNTRFSYSKPLGDIAREQSERLRDDEALLQRQRTLSSMLAGRPQRTGCLLCGASPDNAEHFVHRGVPSMRCAACGHVQTAVTPPEGYPHNVEGGLSFGAIYPRLSPEDYHNRRQRIYTPKFEWIARVLAEELGYSEEDVRAKRWADLGCGAGYFLAALHDAGIAHKAGCDADEHLVELAREFVPSAQTEVFSGDLGEAVRRLRADVYTAFYVMEHIEEPQSVYRALGELPPGAVFVFSVPVYGFSCLLENVFDNNYARAFDTVVHTQVYTDRSIDYAMNTADMDIVAEWVFGQDAEDFRRVMLANLAGKLPASMLAEAHDRLSELLDPLQQCFDTLHMADQRHVLAVRR